MSHVSLSVSPKVVRRSVTQYGKVGRHMLACVGLLGGAAQAQTAHAGGTVRLGGGFNNPF